MSRNSKERGTQNAGVVRGIPARKGQERSSVKRVPPPWERRPIATSNAQSYPHIDLYGPLSRPATADTPGIDPDFRVRRLSHHSERPGNSARKRPASVKQGTLALVVSMARCQTGP